VDSLYLDWSGDAGFRFRRGSSRHLAVACVACPTPFATTVNDICANNRLAKSFYFRFSDVPERLKPVFFQALARTDIRGVVLRIDKSRLPSHFREMRGMDLIAHFIAESLGRLPDTLIANHSLIFDGNRDETKLIRAVRVAVSKRLRSTGKPTLNRVTARPAREEAGLQVADMLAGAAASPRLTDNALFGYLGGDVILADYEE
jgi:Protein of unknown function (DUF3800)